ncbi:hypothetical protein HPB47_004736 [Ixodes persulcatus]|uniref:Uncharacterized protein n=1 Tax=Ixodes persulcatus TaxID=34615 RepID=A0AC60PFQ9_IXOPE|nr:hypothetical protein HPB47_004736 [Ixodes persulcatus]
MDIEKRLASDLLFVAAAETYMRATPSVRRKKSVSTVDNLTLPLLHPAPTGRKKARLATTHVNMPLIFVLQGQLSNSLRQPTQLKMVSPIQARRKEGMIPSRSLMTALWITLQHFSKKAKRPKGESQLNNHHTCTVESKADSVRPALNVTPALKPQPPPSPSAEPKAKSAWESWIPLLQKATRMACAFLSTVDAHAVATRTCKVVNWDLYREYMAASVTAADATDLPAIIENCIRRATRLVKVPITRPVPDLEFLNLRAARRQAQRRAMHTDTEYDWAPLAIRNDKTMTETTELLADEFACPLPPPAVVLPQELIGTSISEASTADDDFTIFKLQYALRHCKRRTLQLKMAGMPIKRVRTHRYLGLSLDDRVTWRPEVRKVLSKCRSLLGVLRMCVEPPLYVGNVATLVAAEELPVFLRADERDCRHLARIHGVSSGTGGHLAGFGAASAKWNARESSHPHRFEICSSSSSEYRDWYSIHCNNCSICQPMDLRPQPFPFAGTTKHGNLYEISTRSVTHTKRWLKDGPLQQSPASCQENKCQCYIG